MKNAFLPIPAPIVSLPLTDHSISRGTKSHDAALEDLAHELRQPLSVIDSLAYYLELTSRDERVCIHLQQIQMMVQQASRILTEATQH